MVSVTRFLAAIHFPGDVVRVPDGLGPDFVIRGTEPLIGIELTELYRGIDSDGVNRRQVEGVRDQVLAGAKALWDAASHPPLEVHVSFNHRTLKTPTKAQIKSLAKRLTEIVQDNLPSFGEHRRLSWDWRHAQSLPDGVHGISIIRLAHERSYWVGTDADFVPPVDAQHLQARIAAKTTKAALYRTASPITWLLIVLESHRLSGSFDLASPAFETMYQSAFARTIVFDAFTSTIRELVTSDCFASH